MWPHPFVEQGGLGAGEDERGAVPVEGEGAHPVDHRAAVWRVQPDAPLPGDGEPVADVLGEPHGPRSGVPRGAARVEIELSECSDKRQRCQPAVVAVRELVARESVATGTGLSDRE